MQAVVLVGGLGTRLLPLTASIPKQLLPVAGVPMIEQVLSGLAAHGVERAVLSMGYLPDPFLEAYPEGTIGGVEVSFAIEQFPLGTAGAIRFAAVEGGIDETFLAVNGDVLTDLDVTALVQLHRAHHVQGTIALTPVEDPSAYGVVVTDDDGLVTAFVEKPDLAVAPSHDINAGIYVLEPAFLGRVAPGVEVSVEREVFPSMVRDGMLCARVDTSYWLDAGTPSAYLRANTDVLEGARAVAHPGTIVSGSLVLSGSSVSRTASVSRSFIGPGAIVADGVTLEGSVVMEGAVICAGATVRDCVVGPGATIGERATIEGASIVGANASVADGARLAAARVAA